MGWSPPAHKTSPPKRQQARLCGLPGLRGLPCAYSTSLETAGKNGKPFLCASDRLQAGSCVTSTQPRPRRWDGRHCSRRMLENTTQVWSIECGPLAKAAEVDCTFLKKCSSIIHNTAEEVG